jgi:hypothetical protein
MFSSFFRAKDSDGSTPGEDGFFTNAFKGLLTGVKVITSAAQALFGMRKTNSWVLNNKDVNLPLNMALSFLVAINSLFYIGYTRGPQMMRPSSKPKQLKTPSDSPVEYIQSSESEEKKSACCYSPEFSDLSFGNKLIYCAITFLSKGSLFFTSIAAYNGAFTLCETLVSITTDYSTEEEILDYINKNPALQNLIQVFSFLCFCAQILSFSMFQSKTVREYLFNWWFNPDKRKQQYASLSTTNNILLLINFLIIIPGTTFFSVFSTEAGLRNLNNSFFKSMLSINIPEYIVDVLIGLSALSVISLTTTNTVPSNYNYFTSKYNPKNNKSLTTTGRILMLSGGIDNGGTAYCTLYGSVNTLSKMFGIDVYNPYLISVLAFLIVPTNLVCTYIYNTHKVIHDLYSVSSTSQDLEENLISYSSELGSSVVVIKEKRTSEEQLVLDDSADFILYRSLFKPSVDDPADKDLRQDFTSSINNTRNDTCLVNVLAL